MYLPVCTASSLVKPLLVIVDDTGRCDDGARTVARQLLLRSGEAQGRAKVIVSHAAPGDPLGLSSGTVAAVESIVLAPLMEEELALVVLDQLGCDQDTQNLRELLAEEEAQGVPLVCTDHSVCL